jgi:hypothetical protein
MKVYELRFEVNKCANFLLLDDAVIKKFGEKNSFSSEYDIDSPIRILFYEIDRTGK